VGGDLTPERILKAYEAGIFPWYSAGEPILWWSPDPRFVLFPEELTIPRSMRQLLKKRTLSCSFDRAFREVVSGCQAPRRSGGETWITEEMAHAYAQLHELGYAHSLEVWQGDELVGGLYGVAIGTCFSGESMFSRVPNASKVAFIRLTETLRQVGFTLIDCQIYSSHLHLLGARELPRATFLTLLSQARKGKALVGHWSMLEFLL